MMIGEFREDDGGVHQGSGGGVIVWFVVPVGLTDGCTEKQAARSGESRMDRTHDICSIYYVPVYEYIYLGRDAILWSISEPQQEAVALRAIVLASRFRAL